MKKEDCFYLGHFSKTYGVKGELILFLDVDDAERYSDLNSVLLEQKTGLLPYFIEEMQSHGKSRYRVKLEDVDTLESAEQILKKDLYLPLSQLPKLGDKQFYYHEVPGFLANMNSGNLGTIQSVMDLPNNPLLVIETKSGEEILVPISDETILHVDRSAQTILLSPPEGLLDLFLEAPGTPDTDDMN